MTSSKDNGAMPVVHSNLKATDTNNPEGYTIVDGIRIDRLISSNGWTMCGVGKVKTIQTTRREVEVIWRRPDGALISQDMIESRSHVLTKSSSKGAQKTACREMKRTGIPDHRWREGDWIEEFERHLISADGDKLLSGFPAYEPDEPDEWSEDESVDDADSVIHRLKFGPDERCYVERPGDDDGGEA